MDKKIKINYIIAGMFILLVFAVFFLDSYVSSQQFVYESDDGKYYLSKGRNLVLFQDHIGVRDLIIKYPEIEAVSYFNYDLNETVGYVNVFGGLGQEFDLLSGNIYQINTKSNLTIVFE